MTRQIFSYWTGTDHSVHSGLLSEWQAEFPQFQIFGDTEVRPLISRYFPDRLEVYDQIRIPTAKSDIAMLILLYEFGGLYIDCHCGIRDASGIRNLLASLSEYDAVFIDRALSPEQPRPLNEHLVINSIIFSRPSLELILRMVAQALSNFALQYDMEHRYGFVEYDIWSLSGPGLVTAMLLEPGSSNRLIRSDSKCRSGRIPSHLNRLDDLP